ncbi:hypothetical protein ON010_g19023 [Phytophthora cinnamomi]|nr:hypothetical protein ON010_g19023 [Phytophthora cinnamomi]
MQRPDETPLDYLYRLNVAGLRANIQVRHALGLLEVLRTIELVFVESLADGFVRLLVDVRLAEQAVKILRRQHGYWKRYAPHNWYKQAKIHRKLDNRCALLLHDTGAEVSILDTTFARDVGCLIDTDITQACVGIRDETYYTVGRSRVKITLTGNWCTTCTCGSEAWLANTSWYRLEFTLTRRTARRASPTRRTFR